MILTQREHIKTQDKIINMFSAADHDISRHDLLAIPLVLSPNAEARMLQNSSFEGLIGRFLTIIPDMNHTLPPNVTDDVYHDLGSLQERHLL